MRIASALIRACTCGLLAATSVSATSVFAEQLDGVAAIVNDAVVLESEVKLASTLLLDRVRRDNEPIPDELREHARNEALKTLIESKLILEFAERRNLAATDADIDAAVSGIAQDEGVSVETVYASAAKQGLDRDYYRSELRNQITRMKVLQNVVRGRVQIEDEEVKELFDQRYATQVAGMRVRVRHILVPWEEQRTPDGDARMREIAEKIRERALASGAFASLARQFSRAPSASEGGLTIFREGDVAPEIAVQVFGLPAGEVSPVVETEHGLNLFQILDRFDPSTVALEDVEDQLRQEVMERKMEPEYEEWIDELRKVHYVHVNSPR